MDRLLKSIDDFYDNDDGDDDDDDDDDYLERSIKNNMARLLISIDDVEETHGVCLVVQWYP